MANAFADFWISWAAGYRIADSQSGERIYPAQLLRLIEAAHDRRSSFTIESEVLIRGACMFFKWIQKGSLNLANCVRGDHGRPIVVSA